MRIFLVIIIFSFLNCLSTTGFNGPFDKSNKTSVSDLLALTSTRSSSKSTSTSTSSSTSTSTSTSKSILEENTPLVINLSQLDSSQSDRYSFIILNLNSSKFQTIQLNTQPDKTYKISWDDGSEGSKTYFADIKVSAFSSNSSINFFHEIDNGYVTPQIISNLNESIILKVECISNCNNSYGIKVTN